MLSVDVVHDIADDADVDSNVISKRDNGVDNHDVNLVDMLAHRSRVADVITFRQEVRQAHDRAQVEPHTRVSSPLRVAPSVDETLIGASHLLQTHRAAVASSGCDTLAKTEGGRYDPHKGTTEKESACRSKSLVDRAIYDSSTNEARVVSRKILVVRHIVRKAKLRTKAVAVAIVGEFRQVIDYNSVGTVLNE